jgi:hypothetical protein
MKVYLIQNDDRKYKIGYTNRNITERIKELQTASPYILQVILEYESCNARQIETIMHKVHSSKKITGEWFDLADSDVEDFVDRCRRIDGNLEYIKQNNTYGKY